MEPSVAADLLLGRAIEAINSAGADGGAVAIAVARAHGAVTKDPLLATHAEDTLAEAGDRRGGFWKVAREIKELAFARWDDAEGLRRSAAQAGWSLSTAGEHLAESRAAGEERVLSSQGWQRVGDGVPVELPGVDEVGTLAFDATKLRKVVEGTPLEAPASKAEGKLRELARAASANLMAYRLADRVEPSVAWWRVNAFVELLNRVYPPDPASLEDTLFALTDQGEAAIVDAVLGRPVDDGLADPPHGYATAVASLADAALAGIQELRRRLSASASRLATVKRFRARAELLDRNRLQSLAREAPSHMREQVLRDEAALFIFDQGLYPLTEVSLGNVRGDIVDLTEPFYIEAKKYSEGDDPVSTVAGGARQVWGSARRAVNPPFGLAEAFLLVFRLGGPHLHAPVDPIVREGIRLHVVCVDIGEASGSRQRHKSVAISAKEIQDA